MLDLAQLCDVCVEEERVRYLGKGYHVMLRLAAGISYPLTQSATVGGRSDVEAVASLVKRFLGLDEMQREQQEYEDYGEDDSTDSEDEAEQL